VDAKEVFHMSELKVWALMKNKILVVKFSYKDWYQCPLECI